MYLNNNMSEIFIPIGSGNIQSPKYGFKAKGLDFAAKNKISVPKGYLLSHEILRNFKHESLEIITLIKKIQELPIQNSFSIRSSFSIEDQKENSLAGMFETVLSVNKNNSEQITDALKKVLNSSENKKGDFRKDVLLMEMVPSNYSGVAFTESEHEDDWVNWTRGFGSKLVSGEVPGEIISIPKLKKWDILKTKNPNLKNIEFYTRLQALLKNVRTVFGEKEWDIEWADDGIKCWLLQIRPITRPLTRNDWFGLCNHKEILPPLPSVLMNSLIVDCSPELFGFYHKVDPELPKNRLMVESFKGRSYFNLSLFSDMLRKWGLPTKLLSESMGGVLEKDYGLNPGRLISNWKVFTKLFFLQANALRKSKVGIKDFEYARKEKTENISELIKRSKFIYTSLVHQMLTLTMVMGGPISFLRYMKTLNYHSANHITPGTRILKDLDSLFTLIKIKPQIKESIDNGKLPEDKEFLNLWTIYLKSHGHRGIYESDLSQPRFRENHEYILKLLSIGESSHKVKIKLSLTSILTLPIWLILKKFIYARENTRYEAMKAFESIREEWLALEVKFKSLNIIPEHASIWNLTLSELSVINSKNIYSDKLYEKRTAEIQANKNHTLPDNLKRQTFLEPFLKTTTENLNKTFTGLGLTGGQVEGTAWVLKKPNLDLPSSFQKKTTILIAPAVDAGWIPTFSQVSGVAVDTGGDLSHGSIILRELGIPAITNAIGVFQNIKTGDKVSLIADEGVLLKR